MCDFRQCSREFIIEFIRIYRENGCLWEVKSEEYMNKDLKQKSYEKLRKKLLEVDKNATVLSAKNKINSLRTNFRAELKKIKNSKKSGAGEDEIYQPSLWYFSELMFLTDHENPRSGVSSRNSASSSLPDLASDDSLFVDSPSPIPPETEQRTPFCRKRRAKNTDVEQAQAVLQQVQEKLNGNKEDDCDIYGKNVAWELRSLPEEDKIYLKKIINDAIFEAKVGRAKQIRIVLEVEPGENIQQEIQATNRQIPIQQFFSEWQRN